jgi:hypothetical protein
MKGTDQDLVYNGVGEKNPHSFMVDMKSRFNRLVSIGTVIYYLFKKYIYRYFKETSCR